MPDGQAKPIANYLHNTLWAFQIQASTLRVVLYRGALQ